MANKLLAYSRLKPGEVKTFSVPLHTRSFAAGCDIDKPVGTYCVIYPNGEGFSAEVQQFANPPSGCKKALAWVMAYAQQYLPEGEKPAFIIESTGPYHLLAVKTFSEKCTVTVVNPIRIKALLEVEGKDDIKDALTLTQLILSFDIKKSVIATGARLRLRKALRLKRKLINNRTQVSNRIGSLLTENALPLATVMKVMSVSGRAFCHAIAKGAQNPSRMMVLWQGQTLPGTGLEMLKNGVPFERALAVCAPEMKKKDVERLKEIFDALYYLPHLEDSVRWLLAQQLRLLDVFDTEIEAIEGEVVAAIDNYRVELPGGTIRTAREAIELALTAPVFNEESARLLIAEVGIDFAEVYGTADALARALGLTASHRKSAGKVVGTGVDEGNKHFKPMIVQGATTFLRRRLKESDQGYYLWSWGRALQARRDAQHARIAVARRATRSVYFMFREWKPYDDSQHVLGNKEQMVKTAKRLSNVAKELPQSGQVGQEVAAELRQVSESINTLLGIQAAKYRLMPFAQDNDVASLELSGRVVKVLEKNGILTVSQLILRLVSGSLSSLSGFGEKSLVEVEEKLISAGYVEVYKA